MRFGLSLSAAALVACFTGLMSPTRVCAQNAGCGQLATVVREIPDAPRPQPAVAELEFPRPRPDTEADEPAQPPTSDQREIVQPQTGEPTKHKLLSFPFVFNSSYPVDVSLTPKQKVNFAFRTAVYPVAFATALAVAGYREALGDDRGYGWGAEGYGKRAGAAYLDTFDGTMIGQGFLPIVFHEDPRYFRLGYGSARNRFLHAATSGFYCRHDKTGKREPNYSNMLGNLAAGGISNLYYPPAETGASATFSTAIIVTAEDGLGSIFREFWPDISRKLFHKDPTNGLDAQAKEQHKAASESGKQHR